MNKNFEFLFKIITLISGASVELEKKRAIFARDLNYALFAKLEAMFTKLII